MREGVEGVHVLRRVMREGDEGVHVMRVCWEGDEGG